MTDQERDLKTKAIQLAKLKATVEADPINAYRLNAGWVGQKYYGMTWYQKRYHMANKRSRWIFWPNQVGKTYSAVADDLMLSLGIHPWIPLPVPNQGAVITISHLKSVQVVRPLFEDMLPRHILDEIFSPTGKGGWPNRNAEKPSRLILPNGSVVHFMSIDQDVMEFESLTLHYCHADEEPRKEIYDAVQVRLLRNQGYWSCSMTPWREEGSAGVSWTADSILGNEKLPPDRRDPEIWVGPYITMFDSPFLPPKEIERWMKRDMSEEEKKARFQGIHMMRSGKIFDRFIDVVFRPQMENCQHCLGTGKQSNHECMECMGKGVVGPTRGHLLPKGFPIHPSWDKWLLIDPSSPSGTVGVLWMAVTHRCTWQGIQFKDNELVFYREYKQKDRTVGIHAKEIISLSKEPLDRKLMDGRFMNQSADADTGENYQEMYERYNLWCESWGANSVQEEIESTKEYIDATKDRLSSDPGLFVVEDLTQLRWEMEHYIYPVHSSGPLKGERKYAQDKKQKGIHLVDCLKAGCNLRPEKLTKHWQNMPDNFDQFTDPVTGY